MQGFGKWLRLNEGHMLKGDYKGSYYQRLVAAMYVLAPRRENNPEVDEGYRQLYEKIERQKKLADSDYQMQPTKDDRFLSFKALKKHVDDQRQAGVRRPLMPAYAPDEGLGPNEDPSQKGHPMWTKEQDALFGYVHDAMSHMKGNHPFTARGEYGAYLRHLQTFCNPEQVKAGKCPIAKVIFTEVVAQTSYYYVYGDFPPQKATILKDFDKFRIGLLERDSRLNAFFEYNSRLKDLVPKEGASVEQLAAADPKLPGEWLRQEELFARRESKPKFGLAQLPANTEL